MKIVIEMPDNVKVSDVYMDVFGLIRYSDTFEWTGGRWYPVGTAPVGTAPPMRQVLPVGTSL